MDTRVFFMEILIPTLTDIPIIKTRRTQDRLKIFIMGILYLKDGLYLLYIKTASVVSHSCSSPWKDTKDAAPGL